MTIGLLGCFHTCDEETHPESSILFDEADYLYSNLTLAFFFVTASKSYLSTFANGIGLNVYLAFHVTPAISVSVDLLLTFLPIE